MNKYTQQGPVEQQQSKRKTAIQLIHIAKSQLALDETTYRQMLTSITGQNSCSKLALPQLQQVLDHLKSKGFKTKTRRYGKRPNPTTNRTAMMGKVEALLADGNLHWNYAHAMAKRMFQVEKVDWLEPDQLRKLIAALEYNAKRKA
ncbi:regulatory protein GemA [Pontibacterium granulatum]|uniref:gp16 family protein n=1 Tax=Pontibacterium granulatum TaxID=2036029 RepID=UPI00249BCCF7|nr:regulatory protein GemA [Pontibacterium granulatum]MDI3325597.1 regulatory protein GemA [Pontibacterium granulatum]